MWNGKPLKLILDHKNGVNSGDRFKNLRLLCPNCDSQNIETRGGANKGRVTKYTGGHAIKGPDSITSHTLIASRGDFEVNGPDADLDCRRLCL